MTFLRGGPDLGVVQELSGSYAGQDALWTVGPPRTAGAPSAWAEGLSVVGSAARVPVTSARTVGARTGAPASRLDDVEARRHQLAYDQAPENSPDVEDAGDPRYWVTEVLQMLVDALVAAQSDGRDIVPSVATGSLNCFGNVDGVLEGPEHRARRQELAETEAREECLRILSTDLPLVEQAARIRALSEQRARELPVPTLEQIRYTSPPIETTKKHGTTSTLPCEVQFARDERGWHIVELLVCGNPERYRRRGDHFDVIQVEALIDGVMLGDWDSPANQRWTEALQG